MNIILIGNCQVQPIGDGLALCPEVENIYSVPIHLAKSASYNSVIDKIQQSKCKNYTILQFDNLLSKVDLGDEVLSRVEKIYSFTQIYFWGLHPDITYFGALGKRILSPLGDYHSKICLLAYMKGYSLENCIKLFNQKTYERLNYFDLWDTSSDELRLRDKKVDIQFGDDFLSMVKSEPTLFTVNHPIGTVFDRLVKKITQSIGISSTSYPSSFFYNYLATNAWWPVYREMIDHHNISYDSPMMFKPPDNLGRKFYDLNQFVTASYKAYSESNIDSSRLPPVLKNNFDAI
jgi:hypothetical protein